VNRYSKNVGNLKIQASEMWHKASSILPTLIRCYHKQFGDLEPLFCVPLN